MTLIQALILGLVQGLAEFFPLSSSAHLRLAKWFMGIADGERLLYFDLLCHVGTLFALLIYLRREVWQTLLDWKKIALFFLALLPLIPAYFLLKPVRVALSDPSYLGYCLLLTALLLFLASRKIAPSPVKKWGDVLCIGMMQAFALIPGISRSGATIAMARFRGWSWSEAARFSFLLSIPAIVGGELLETYKLLRGQSEAAGLSLSCYASGFLASFGMGWVAVRCIFWMYEKEKVRPFAWYCLGVGLLAWAIFHGKTVAS